MIVFQRFWVKVNVPEMVASFVRRCSHKHFAVGNRLEDKDTTTTVRRTLNVHVKHKHQKAAPAHYKRSVLTCALSAARADGRLHSAHSVRDGEIFALSMYALLAPKDIVWVI